MALGIKPDLKNYPVAKPALQLRLFHSALGTQIWFPLGYCNAGAFLDTKENVHRFAKRISRQARQFKPLVDAHLYTPRPGAYWDTRQTNFTVHATYNLTALLEDLQQLRRDVRYAAQRARQLEANRRFTLVLLELSEDQLQALKSTAKLQQQLVDLLTNSEQERIYIFLLGEKVRAMPELVLRTLQWAAFVGEENARLAQAIFKKEENIYNEKRQYLGLLLKHHEDTLVPLHDLNFNPSAWKLARDRFSEVEEEAYQKFLSSLD